MEPSRAPMIVIQYVIQYVLRLPEAVLARPRSAPAFHLAAPRDPRPVPASQGDPRPRATGRCRGYRQVRLASASGRASSSLETTVPHYGAPTRSALDGRIQGLASPRQLISRMVRWTLPRQHDPWGLLTSQPQTPHCTLALIRSGEVLWPWRARSSRSRRRVQPKQ